MNERNTPKEQAFLNLFKDGRLEKQASIKFSIYTDDELLEIAYREIGRGYIVDVFVRALWLGFDSAWHLRELHRTRERRIISPVAPVELLRGTDGKQYQIKVTRADSITAVDESGAEIHAWLKDLIYEGRTDKGLQWALAPIGKPVQMPPNPPIYEERNPDWNRLARIPSADG